MNFPITVCVVLLYTIKRGFPQECKQSHMTELTNDMRAWGKSYVAIRSLHQRITFYIKYKMYNFSSVFQILLLLKKMKNIIVSSDNIKIGQIQNKIELLEYSKKVAWSVIWPECGEGKMEAFWSVHRLRFESWIISDQIVVELSNLHWKKEKTECNKVGKFHLIWRISIFLLHTLLVVFLCVFVGWLLLDLGKVYMLETPAAHDPYCTNTQKLLSSECCCAEVLPRSNTYGIHWI